MRICEAKFGTLFRFDGNMFHVAAQVGTPLELAEFQRRRGSFQPGPDTPFLDRVMRTKQVSHTADEAAEAVSGPSAKLGGARSLVGVPTPAATRKVLPSKRNSVPNFASQMRVAFSRIA